MKHKYETCPKCQGKSHIICETCNGGGDGPSGFPCGDCDGTGYAKCDLCNGTDVIEVRVEDN